MDISADLAKSTFQNIVEHLYTATIFESSLEKAVKEKKTLTEYYSGKVIDLIVKSVPRAKIL